MVSLVKPMNILIFFHKFISMEKNWAAFAEKTAKNNHNLRFSLKNVLINTDIWYWNTPYKQNCKENKNYIFEHLYIPQIRNSQLKFLIQSLKIENFTVSQGT